MAVSKSHHYGMRLVNAPGEYENLVAKHPEVVTKLSSRVKFWGATLPKDDLKTDVYDR